MASETDGASKGSSPSPTPPAGSAAGSSTAGPISSPLRGNPPEDLFKSLKAAPLAAGAQERDAFSSSKPTGWHAPGVLWLFLIILTALGGFLRFWRLDFQAYWTDEAYTIGRISGTFDYMLKRLADQGFPPGWYVVLRGWCLWIESQTGSGAEAFSPFCTRFLTAIIGTLMVPAMYFLARQFTDRRGALLVTLLTAVNPFLIYYSREIKMYGPLWFLVALNVALFLKWQGSARQWLWFPLYVVTGAAMAAMHAVAWFIIALELVFILTRRRVRPLDGPLWALGAGIMSYIPVWWFTQYTHPAQWVGRLSNDVDASMDWIKMYTDMSWRTIASLPTTHLLGYMWPVYPPDDRLNNWFLLGSDFNQHLATRSWSWLATAEWYVAVAVLVMLFAGLIRWRVRHSLSQREDLITRGRWWWVALWIVVPTAGLALTWIPPDSPWFARVWHGLTPKPIWEPRYLGIVTPALLLWLGSSLRRLPFLTFRIVAIAFVVTVCGISSLSNHLIYRNAPFHRVARIVEEYADRHDRATEAAGVPAVKYPDVAENVAWTVARGARPGTQEDTQYVAFRLWSRGLTSENTVAAWVRGVIARNPRVTTLVLTDKYGDITDRKDPLSDDMMGQLLGPRWKLVREESYVWHYEWRYYIFHTWRTRVWQASGPAPEPMSWTDLFTGNRASTAPATRGADTRPAGR